MEASRALFAEDLLQFPLQGAAVPGRARAFWNVRGHLIQHTPTAVSGHRVSGYSAMTDDELLNDGGWVNCSMVQ